MANGPTVGGSRAQPGSGPTVGGSRAQPGSSPMVGGSRAQRTTGRALRANPKPKPKVKPKRKPVKPKPRAAASDPFNAPLTPETLDSQVQAQTQLYAGEAEAGLNDERAVHQQQTTVVPAWYEEYKQALASARVNTQNAYGAALGVQQQTADSSSALDATQRASQAQQMQADAASRGATVDPAIAAQGQQAAAARRNTLDQQRGLTATLGANQVAFRANREVVGAGQKVVAMEGEAARGRNIERRAGDLALKKGAYAATTRQKLIDSEHTKQLENKAFGLNVAKANADASNDATALKLKAASDAAQRTLDAAKLSNDSTRIQIAQQQADTAQQRADAYVANQGRTKAGTKVTPQAKASTGKARSDVEYARRQIEALRTHRQPVKTPELDKDGKPTGKMVNKIVNGKVVLEDAKLTGAQIRQALLNGDGPLRPVNNDAINAALKLLEPGGGYLSAAQISGLRRAYPGIRIADLGYQTENGRARARRGSRGPQGLRG